MIFCTMIAVIARFPCQSNAAYHPPAKTKAFYFVTRGDVLKNAYVLLGMTKSALPFGSALFSYSFQTWSLPYSSQHSMCRVLCN